MNAVNWKNAPQWANWAAMDEAGAWYWFETEPALCEDLGLFSAGSSRLEAVRHSNWKNSLRARGDSRSIDEPEPLTLQETQRCRDEGFDLATLRAVKWTDAQLVDHGYAEWR